MCKIITLTNTKKIKNIDKVINYIAKQLAQLERDGFGYCIQGKQGTFGERTLFPSAFKTSFHRPIFKSSFVSDSYSRFGTKDIPIGAGLFHGRTSTNHKTIVNTHPINKHDWHLIHNGVVTNIGESYETITTNDTEHLVHYLANQGIRAIEENLTGYYAVTALSPDGRLHVIKDSTANLYSAKIETINSIVFATTQALIEDLCKHFKWKCSTISPVKDNVYLIFEGNQLIHQENIIPKGRTFEESRFASLSLGRDLEDMPTVIPFREVPPESTRTYSEESFLNEVNQYLDGSYTIKDFRGNDLPIEEFRLLTDDDKLDCTVIRSDGTIVCPLNYDEESLYYGT